MNSKARKATVLDASSLKAALEAAVKNHTKALHTLKDKQAIISLQHHIAGLHKNNESRS